MKCARCTLLETLDANAFLDVQEPSSTIRTRMENREIARLLYETADLMEIAAEDGFRIRSYRNAAGVIEGYPERIADIRAIRTAS